MPTFSNVWFPARILQILKPTHANCTDDQVFVSGRSIGGILDVAVSIFKNRRKGFLPERAIRLDILVRQGSL